MLEDSALTLKKSYDKGVFISIKEAKNMLEQL